MKMTDGEWIKEADVAITVCDTTGIILEMNEKSRKIFKKDGGGELIGRNVLDCHPQAARDKLADMLQNRTANCYTTEKNGIKKLVYQTPWYKDGEYMGFVELVMEIPLVAPHFKR